MFSVLLEKRQGQIQEDERGRRRSAHFVPEGVYVAPAKQGQPV